MAPDVIIIGAGVIGLAIARALAQRRLRVAVLERGEPGREASWAAAGMLAPQGEVTAQGVFLDLGLRSRELYPGFAAALKEETGLDIEYRTEGALHLALDDEEADHLREIAAHQERAGFSAEWLDGSDVRRLEPDLTPRVRGALFVAGDHQVDNRKLVTALIRAVERAGVELRPGTPVTGLAAQGPRVIGVRTAAGRLAAGAVINAAGCWAGGFPSPDAPERPRVRPIKGQMVACAMGPEAELRRIVATRQVYLVPRADGRLLVGATVEERGFDKRVTVAAVQGLLAAAVEALPGLVEMPLVDAWAGLRPGTSDGMPILGPAEPEGLVLATGHHRNGILLAPITAELIAQTLTSGEVPAMLAPFAPSSFVRVPSGVR